MSSRDRSSSRSILSSSLLAAACWAAATAAIADDKARSFDCMIEAAQIVEIRSPVAGLIQQVHVRRGELIREGQLLVTIESSVERSAAEVARFRAEASGALQTARNRAAAAREKAERTEALFKEEFVSAQARDDAAAELKVAESELKSALEAHQLAQLEHRQSLDQLQRRQIRAPFSGVVMDQYLFAGALADGGGDSRKPILKIAQTRPLAVHALLPFQLFKSVRPGQPVTLTPEAPFGGAIRARVRTVDRVVDSAAGTFGIVAELPNPDNAVPAGIRCKLRFD